MNCNTFIERDPRVLVAYAIDVLEGACASDATVTGNEFTHAAAIGASRFLKIVQDSMGDIDSFSSFDERLRAYEDRSLDVGQGIGLITAIIGDFTGSGHLDSSSLEAVRVLLMLAKIQVDEATERLMADERAAREASPVDAQRDFMTGVALAASMLDTAASLKDGACELLAENRDEGMAQVDFARTFLDAVMNQPALLPGFSAVLSFILKEEQTFYSQHVLKTYEEIVGKPLVVAKPTRAKAKARKAVAA